MRAFLFFSLGALVIGVGALGLMLHAKSTDAAAQKRTAGETDEEADDARAGISPAERREADESEARDEAVAESLADGAGSDADLTAEIHAQI